MVRINRGIRRRTFGAAEYSEKAGDVSAPPVYGVRLRRAEKSVTTQTRPDERISSRHGAYVPRNEYPTIERDVYSTRKSSRFRFDIYATRSRTRLWRSKAVSDSKRPPECHVSFGFKYISYGLTANKIERSTGTIIVRAQTVLFARKNRRSARRKVGASFVSLDR